MYYKSVSTERSSKTTKTRRLMNTIIITSNTYFKPKKNQITQPIKYKPQQKQSEDCRFSQHKEKYPARAKPRATFFLPNKTRSERDRVSAFLTSHAKFEKAAFGVYANANYNTIWARKCSRNDPRSLSCFHFG